ncbi:MAG: NosD domain-containing protein, partial [Candidatus Bathyarchaeia archaeon]
GNNHVIQGFNTPFSTGIDLTARRHVTVKNVRVQGFYFGFSLNYSQYNVIWGNTIYLCSYIISAVESEGNRIYNNNFLSVPNRVYGGMNIWDGGYPDGGNFWANMYGEDLYSGELQNITGSDGICDQIYEINEDNFDSYPLMGFFSVFKAEKQGETYPIYVVSNSKVLSVSYDPSASSISLHISGKVETSRFCRMLIPYELLEEPYMVLINGQEPVYVDSGLYSNGTHSWIYFGYNSREEVNQVHIVPEFSPALTLCSLAILTLLIIYRRKYVKIE